MNKSRLNKIEKALKPNINNCSLFAIEHLKHPEKNKYILWDGIPGSGGKQIPKEEFIKLSELVKQSKVNVRGNPVVIVDDIE